jgi:hypothetical protein
MTDDVVTVANFATASEAEAAKLTLEAEGIKCVIADMDWTTLGVPAANVRLQVEQENAEKVIALLAERGHTSTRSQPESDDGPDLITCLECGKEIPEGTSKCPACGWTYVA